MKKMLFQTIMILLGNFILAISVTYLILPFKILSGGVAGIAIAIEPLFHLNQTLVINGLVLGMFILGSLVLKKEFAIKTVVSSLVYPIFISILSYFPYQIQISEVVASFYGGALAGLGIGLVFRVDASTGGMDVPALILAKWTGIETNNFVLIIDGITVLLGLFNYGLEAVLIGLISVVSCSYMIGRTVTFGGTNSKAVQIISEKWELLNTQINQELDRGTTLISAKGGYTMDQKQIILVVVDQRQYPKLVELVNSIDKTAFMITSDATDVHGEGFKLEFRV